MFLKILFILLNLLALPGLGTLCSGRKKTGICQMCLAAAGYALSFWSVGVLLNAILRSGLNPMELSEAMANETLMPLPEFLFHIGLASAGMVIFGISWVWAALTPQGRLNPPPLPHS